MAERELERLAHAQDGGSEVRTGFRGKLEHRDGTTNVVVSQIDRLDQANLPEPKTRRIEPPHDRETGREPNKPWKGEEVISELDRPGRAQIVAELVSALPPRQSFGRRG